MELSRAKVCLVISLQFLDQFAQSFRCYALVNDSADGQIGTLLALILAKPASEVNGSIQAGTLQLLVEDGKVLGVSARETRTPKANHYLHGGFILRSSCCARGNSENLAILNKQ